MFSNLNPEKARATEKDVFFNNKTNALSIDEESRELTTKQGQLVFTGHFKKPFFDSENNSICESWKTMPVSFDRIKLDPSTHKPYFTSFDEQYKKATTERHMAELQIAIKAFELIALEEDPDYPSRKKCAAQLISVELYDSEDLYSNFLKFIKALLSVRDGQVYFPNQAGKWTWLANYVWDHHVHYWLVFLYTVKEYKRTEMVFDKHNEKLSKKRERFRNDWRTDPDLKQSSKYYPLFLELLPKLKGRLVAPN